MQSIKVQHENNILYNQLFLQTFVPWTYSKLYSFATLCVSRLVLLKNLSMSISIRQKAIGCLCNTVML
jgi:hypothetical protein